MTLDELEERLVALKAKANPICSDRIEIQFDMSPFSTIFEITGPREDLDSFHEWWAVHPYAKPNEIRDRLLSLGLEGKEVERASA